MSGCHSKTTPLTSPTVLEAIAARVQQIAKTPGCSFGDFSGAFAGWERSTVTLLYRRHTFRAYAEIADLAAGSREAPFLV